MPAGYPKSLKKLKILILSIFVIFYLAYGYLDIFVQPSSIYLVVGKQVCLLLCWVVPSAYCILTKSTWTLYAVFVTVVWAIIIGWRTYDDLRKFNKNSCPIKFGIEFNERRQFLGVARIPSAWQMTIASDTEIIWKEKSSEVGHIKKTVYIDSTCKDQFEIDLYKLKPTRGKARRITVYIEPDNFFTRYIKYDWGDSSRAISGIEADSIFVAEKIQKDY